jgi:hypothetical protein
MLFLWSVGVQLPLFVATIDWGRWISVDLSLLTAMLLWTQPEAQGEPVGPCGPAIAARPAATLRTAIQLLLVVAYVGTWGIRHTPLWSSWIGVESSALARPLFEPFEPQCGEPPVCSKCEG